MRFANFLVLLAFPVYGPAQETAPEERLPLFRNDTVLKAVLTAPISQVYAQRHQDYRIYMPGQWTFIDDDGDTRRLEVSVRTRGNFRREICQLPPLQLNFKKSEVEDTLFDGQDKIKLVAPCREGDRYQQYVILEYLAYRILEVLTDYSFSTRLVRLSYVDLDEKLDPWTSFGFLIEDEADMARRLGLERIKIESLLYAQLNHPHAALAQLFQFMIANNDYSVIKPSGEDDCCHNVQLIGVEQEDGSVGNDSVIPVPFDFDFSGLVNASYAAPPDLIPVRDVRERYFYGLCQPQPAVDEAIAHIQSKRVAILALFENQDELDDGLRKRNIDYIQDFFDIIDDPDRVADEIVRRCRGADIMERHFGDPTDSTSGPPDPF